MVRPIFIIIAIVLIFLLTRARKYEVTYVTSDIDGEKYLVRDMPDKQTAANMLAKLKKDLKKLSDHVTQHINEYDEYREYIEQLNRNFRNTIINESTEDNKYTSYSINKGEQIVFCLRSKYNTNKLHDYNLIMYVAIHELSHVACPETGHTPLFKRIFAFLTEVAMELQIYNRIPFGHEPTEYCGLMITDSIV